MNCLPPKPDRDAHFWATYRNRLHITPELIAHCRALAKAGLKPGEIATQVNWPPYVSLRRLQQWVGA
jgi:DNA mismatch repair protein MutH